MDEDKRESGGGGDCGSKKKINNNPKNNAVGGENVAEALRKCLEENKGERTKCKSVVDAFQSSSPNSTAPKKPIGPFSIGRVSLTDV